MTSPRLMLANNYQAQDPTGFWLSEKLDGVRVEWTGEKLLSREGNLFFAPAWFIDSLPSGVRLDGELFMGRGLFQATVARVRSHNDKWHDVRFMVFDLVAGGSFESRQEQLDYLDLPQHCHIVEQVRCRGPQHLAAYQADILRMGGEGVMLRRPGSSYVPGRSNELLKLKERDTAEATVVGHQPGKGQHLGRLGALICDYNGQEFKVGTGFDAVDREHPPHIGKSITFSYFGLTDAGKPRHSSFVIARDYE